MRRIITAIALSTALFLISVGAALAEVYVTNRDGVTVTKYGRWGTDHVHCSINNKGTKVDLIRRISYRDSSVIRSLEIRVLEGNCSGFIGEVHPNSLQRPTAANNAQQEVFTTGSWGGDVPVFRDRNSYFNARDNGKIENVVCRLKKGMHVKFTPYRDWGVGEVVRDDCKGWIDRGVIR